METLRTFLRDERVTKEAELVKGFNSGEFYEYKCGFLYNAYNCPNYEINNKANDKMSFFILENDRLKEVKTSFKEIDTFFKKNKELKRIKYPRFNLERL